jgi:hypothetical protein
MSPIIAGFTGSTICSAEGLTATGYAPALDLCRLLVADGHDPSTPLHVNRDGVLALRIRSIGEGAQLCVEDDRIGKPRFARKRGRSTGAARSSAKSVEAVT